MIESMRNETLPELIAGRLHRSAVTNLIVVVAASFLLALSAQVSVPLPFSAVPMTLQPLALLLIGATLGSTRGFAAAALYLLEGMSGLPVFAHGTAGPAVLFGPTAGFLIAFPFAAGIAGFFSERGWTRGVPETMVSMSIALSVVYFVGWSWLAGVWQLGAEKAFVTGVAPFVVADLVKVAMAAVLLPSAQKVLSPRG